MSSDGVEFNGIFVESMGALQDGYLKLSNQSVLFKNASTGKLQTIPIEQVDAIYWQKLGNRPGIKLATRDGLHHRFGGFKESDLNKISAFSQSKWNQPVGKQEICLKGWNYGEMKFEGQNLEFEVENKPVFEIPLSNVAHCTGTKTEAILEFHPNDDCPVQLSEMRLHIPHPVAADGENGEEGAEKVEDPVEEFRKAVMQFAEVETDAGQPLTILQEILLATPRGRYDIKVFQNHLSLRGKTFDYKIQMKNITRMFLLPHKDGRQMFFAISIDPPIRQGLTKYHFIVIECSKDDEIELELGGGLTPEQLKEQKLETPMKGPLYQVMARLFRSLVNQRVTIPGNFIGASGTPAVSCALRQSSGWLYPLEKGFAYMYKPPMYIRFDDIDNVNFARSDISTRSFDFEIMLKSGTTVLFGSVGKEEYNKLFDYVKGKGLKIRNATRMDKPLYKEDKFADSDEDVDHYKEGLKKDARHRGGAGGSGGGGGGDSDDDEEDEDYDMEADAKKQKKAREESSSEGSGSEPDEEFDSGDSEVSDDLIGKSNTKKKGKKSPKKSSSGKASSSKAGTSESPSKKAPTSKEFVDDSDEDSDSAGGGGEAAKSKPSSSKKGEPPAKKSKEQASSKAKQGKKSKGQKESSEEEEEESSAGSTPGSSDEDD